MASPVSRGRLGCRPPGPLGKYGKSTRLDSMFAKADIGFAEIRSTSFWNAGLVTCRAAGGSMMSPTAGHHERRPWIFMTVSAFRIAAGQRARHWQPTAAQRQQSRRRAAAIGAAATDRPAFSLPSRQLVRCEIDGYCIGLGRRRSGAVSRFDDHGQTQIRSLLKSYARIRQTQGVPGAWIAIGAPAGTTR